MSSEDSFDISYIKATCAITFAITLMAVIVAIISPEDAFVNPCEESFKEEADLIIFAITLMATMVILLLHGVIVTSSEDSFDNPCQKYYIEAKYAIICAITSMATIVTVADSVKSLVDTFNDAGYAITSAITLMPIVIVCATWFWRQPAARFPRPRRWRSGPRRIRRLRILRLHFTRQELPRRRNIGLDSAILTSIPVFVYKSQNFRDGLVCGVCQCALQENENGRTLPNCKHSFHVDCIDMWFLSNSTCPFRTSAQPEEQVLKSARVEQVSATMSESITSGATTISIRSGEQRQSSSSCGREKQMSAEKDGGASGGRTLIPLNIYEQPRRLDGFSSPVEAHEPCSPTGSQSSSRSPVACHISLSTMIVGRDTERVPVIPSDYPAECNDENNDQ